MARLFTGKEVIDSWNPLDGVPPPDYVPSEWNGPHVASRLADAWRTLMKIPMLEFGPRSFGKTWPAYRIEWTDLLSMVGAGELEAMQREHNRTRVLPSANEISKMEKAISWPLRYLANARDVLIVNVCARMIAIDGNLRREIKKRRYGGDAEQWRKQNWRLCDNIADGLIGERVLVF
jgi:hypothetical protein